MYSSLICGPEGSVELHELNTRSVPRPFETFSLFHTPARSERVGETAFRHDPNYKPPHAVVDKWYRTEAGPKNSLAGRVEESRWQSCHSMQTGREPRNPTRSRLPWDQKKAGPGPASYHMRDPWEVRVRPPERGGLIYIAHT